MNNKGFTLLEMMVVVALMGILSTMMLPALISWIKVTKTVTTKLNNANLNNPATAPGADQRTYLPTQGQCKPLAGTPYFAKRQAAREVGFYSGSNCSFGSMGTLTAQTNPTYDDDSTNTFWNVSGDGATIRVLVRKLNLPK